MHTCPAAVWSLDDGSSVCASDQLLSVVYIIKPDPTHAHWDARLLGLVNVGRHHFPSLYDTWVAEWRMSGRLHRYTASSRVLWYSHGLWGSTMFVQAKSNDSGMNQHHQFLLLFKKQLTIYSAKATIVPRRLIWSWYTGRWWVGCLVQWGTVSRGLGGAVACPGPSSPYQMEQPTHQHIAV